MASAYSFSDVTIFYSEKELMNNVFLTISEGDRIGVVGRNGAGKSTFLRLLSGKEEPDHGEISVKRGMSVAYLPQTPVLREDDTITQAALDYLPARQGEDLSSAAYEAQTILTQLGFADLNQPVRELSGGQKMRVALAGALCRKSDVLLLDEPTNHLDADSIEWLRGYLKKYEGGFLVISHSTELLDEVVNKVWHLDAQLGQIDMYSLGWKAYLHQRVVDEERRRREREVAEKKAERLMQQGIRLHAKATKAVAAQNMMRRAEKLLENISVAISSIWSKVNLSTANKSRRSLMTWDSNTRNI